VCDRFCGICIDSAYLKTGQKNDNSEEFCGENRTKNHSTNSLLTHIGIMDKSTDNGRPNTGSMSSPGTKAQVGVGVGQDKSAGESSGAFGWHRWIAFGLLPITIPLLIVFGPKLFLPSKPMISVAIAKVGMKESKKSALRGGMKLEFSVFAREYSHKGNNYVMMDIELLRAGVVVERRTNCEAFELEGYGGGSSITHNNTGCDMPVPKEGADEIRVRTWMKYTTRAATFSGLEVLVYEDK
jgi:hypothetical protein